MGNIRHKWLASWMITEMKKKNIYIYISSKTIAPELSKIRAESVIKSRERKG